MRNRAPERFPWQGTAEIRDNPATRLFGKRFFSDQSVLEFLAEFLAVVHCPKKLGGDELRTSLPDWAYLSGWPEGEPLQYRPPIRLNVKLLAFLGASPVDTRHGVHLKQYRALAARLAGKIEASEDHQEVAAWLEDLLRGYQGAGANRTWCAQTFFPIASSLLTRETIWAMSRARKYNPANWDSVLADSADYFPIKRNFLAKGGELLYLGLCNALRAPAAGLAEFTGRLRASDPECLTTEEMDPAKLHLALEEGLSALDGAHTRGLNALVEWVENLDEDTHQAVNAGRGREGWLQTEWCPRESWPEGYLFAVELKRVLQAVLDPVSRVELLMTGCALQVLRSLCAQSARYADVGRTDWPLGYTWMVAPPEVAQRAERQAAQRNLQAVARIIYEALRDPALAADTERDRYTAAEGVDSAVDSKYGHKLFVSLGKRLGLIAPRTGRGAKLVMTDGILRYLVLALLRPGERCTYDSFVRRLQLHYGIVVEGEAWQAGLQWSGLPLARAPQGGNGSWLANSLRAGGFLTELSDACSMVRNIYAPEGDEGVAR